MKKDAAPGGGNLDAKSAVKIRKIAKILHETNRCNFANKSAALNQLIDLGYLAWFTFFPPEPPVDPELQARLLKFAWELYHPQESPLMKCPFCHTPLCEEPEREEKPDPKVNSSEDLQNADKTML